MQNLEDILEGRFFFDPQDPIYMEHFPGCPVVPASLIIDAFMSAVKSALKDPDARTVENFRFRRFISPGCYIFRLQNTADRGIRCTLYDGGRTVASGTLRREFIV